MSDCGAQIVHNALHVVISEDTPGNVKLHYTAQERETESTEWMVNGGEVKDEL